MARNREVDVRAEEAARYRVAAEEALAQLDWCVNFLYRVRKDRIAQVIEKNRASIAREMNQTER